MSADGLEGRITPEALEDYNKRVGMELRVSNVFNEVATARAIERFCDGVGEANPLYRDAAYAARSVWGGLIAPPSFVMSVFPGWILQGLPGVHAFHTSFDFEFFESIREGDRLVPASRFVGYQPTHTKFGADALFERQESRYVREDGSLVARALVTGLRVERDAVRRSGAYDCLELPHPWKADELARLRSQMLAAKPRGSRVLYYEDVQVGDKLPELIKGPLGLTDILAYCVGASPVHLVANELAVAQFEKHPAWEVQDSDSHTIEPVFGVHYNQSAASLIGMPYPYDIGSQRFCWQVQALTNWMGDAGRLMRCKVKFKEFVFFSDVVYLNGEVVSKGLDAKGHPCVTVRTSSTNQRGAVVMDGVSVIALPSRDAN